MYEWGMTAVSVWLTLRCGGGEVLGLGMHSQLCTATKRRHAALGASGTLGLHQLRS